MLDDLNYKNLLIQLENEDLKIYSKLSNDIKIKYDVIDAYLKNPRLKLNGELGRIEYFLLNKEELINLNLNMRILERCRLSQIEKLQLVKNVCKVINDEEKAEYFYKNFQGNYNYFLLNAFKQNDYFKKYELILVEAINDPYKILNPFMRELDLKKQISYENVVQVRNKKKL